MSKRNNGDMNKINKKEPTHTGIQEHLRKEMVALGYHSDFGIYWDLIPSPVLCI